MIVFVKTSPCRCGASYATRNPDILGMCPRCYRKAFAIEEAKPVEQKRQVVNPNGRGFLQRMGYKAG